MGLCKSKNAWQNVTPDLANIRHHFTLSSHSQSRQLWCYCTVSYGRAISRRNSNVVILCVNKCEFVYLKTVKWNKCATYDSLVYPFSMCGRKIGTVHILHHSVSVEGYCVPTLPPLFLSLSLISTHTKLSSVWLSVEWMPVTNRYELTPATWHKIICNIQLYANFARCVSTSIHATPTYLSYWYANIEHTLKLFLFSLSLRWLLNILKHFFNCIFTSMLFHSITSITRTI